MRKSSIWGVSMIGALVCAGMVCADMISLNFSENAGNQPFTGGELIGPLSSDSANWNTTDFPDTGGLVSGTKGNLVDDTGANTGVSVVWDSSNSWYTGDGTSDDEHRMAVGYLDDGEGAITDGIGVSVVFDNIPYSQYKVYGLLASDQGNPYDARDVNVNGSWIFGDGSNVRSSYGSIESNLVANGSFWTETTDTVAGNYWTVISSGSTLTVNNQPRNGAQRGTITGIIIEEIIPEPSTFVLLGLGALALVLRRRR